LRRHESDDLQCLSIRAPPARPWSPMMSSSSRAAFVKFVAFCDIFIGVVKGIPLLAGSTIAKLISEPAQQAGTSPRRGVRSPASPAHPDRRLPLPFAGRTDTPRDGGEFLFAADVLRIAEARGLPVSLSRQQAKPARAASTPGARAGLGWRQGAASCTLGAAMRETSACPDI
jgi:hypothetical protein